MMLASRAPFKGRSAMLVLLKHLSHCLGCQSAAERNYMAFSKQELTKGATL
jgi:hypothetical protein